MLDGRPSVKRTDVTEDSDEPAAADIGDPPLGRSMTVLLEPGPTLTGPQFAALVPAGLDERRVPTGGDGIAVDLEPRDVDAVARSFVVIGRAHVVCAEVEAAGFDAHPLLIVNASAGRRQLGRGCRLVSLEVGPQIECLENRLLVLSFVLHRHVKHITIADQRVRISQVGLRQDRKRFTVYLVEIIARLSTIEYRELTATPAWIVKRVVKLVSCDVMGGAAVEPTQKPQLLEVGDVAHVPDNRAHDRGVLFVEVVVCQQAGHRKGPLADPVEVRLKLSLAALDVGWGDHDAASHSRVRELLGLDRSESE